MLTVGLDAQEMRPLFQPGFAGENLDALLWEREHGEAKRVAVVAETLAIAAWNEQVAAPVPETLKTRRS